MAGTFELYRDKAGEFRFRLKAGNGEPVLASEGYKSKASAENGIASVQKNAPTIERFENRETKGGDPYFVLKAGNHEVIGKGQSYSSAAARDSGIEAVQRAAAGAKIVDET